MKTVARKSGKCLCCGEPVGKDSFFLPGHDKKAVDKIILEKYGSTANFVASEKDSAE